MMTIDTVHYFHAGDGRGSSYLLSEHRANCGWCWPGGVHISKQHPHWQYNNQIISYLHHRTGLIRTQYINIS